MSVRRIDRLTAPATEERFNLSDYFNYLGNQYPLGLPQTTWTPEKAEPIGNDFAGYAELGHKSNGVVFACQMARTRVFTEARFQFRRVRATGPGDLFGTPALALLEKPWPTGTTGDLLARMALNEGLAGNFYAVRVDGGKRIACLRPDWCGIVIESPSGDPDDPDAAPTGLLYWPGGRSKAKKPIAYPAGSYVHYCPTPDPTAKYRGMSWLTPVVREIQADGLATRHKERFFENAATPNMAVSMKEAVTPEQFREFVTMMNEQHQGVENAYKTLYLANGADVTVLGSSMRELEFKVTQGAGETRIAAAAAVPPVIVGLSEGLAAATYSNYGQARRKFADDYLRPAWRTAAAALTPFVSVPADAELWYDARDISFLQEDAKDAADIQAVDAQSIRTLVDGGFDPASVVAAVNAQDLSLLVHTGKLSVQLQEPGKSPGGNP